LPDVGVPDVGPLLAIGRSADVFECGPGRVLRRYRPSADADAARDVAYEAAVMRHVRAAGYPVPAVHDADGLDLVMDRVDGPTMLHVMARRPWLIRRMADVLADLHRRLHAIEPAEWYRPEFGGGPAILHMDLHPLNVLMTDGGPVVIDWPNARSGPGAADVAHTWIVMATASPTGRVERAVAKVGRSAFLRRFLSHFDRSDLLSQLPAVSHRWLSDRNVAQPEREATARFLKQVGVPGPPVV